MDRCDAALIYTTDAFQTGAAVAPRDREAIMFLTFNRSDGALAGRARRRTRGGGQGRRLVPVRRRALPAKGNAERRCIEPHRSDQEYADRFFAPGIQRGGGLRVARLLTENRE
jgi:hypothetical protein